MKTSYTNPEEVILLLKDMTGKVEPVSVEERQNMMDNGADIRSIFIKEYEITKEYTNIVNSYMDDYIPQMAKYVGILAEQLYAAKGKNLVLVNIIRAGIPIGILIRRYIDKYYGVKIPHYGISLVNGLDENAMKYIITKHGTKGIQFIDGWTGSGRVAKEVRESATRFKGVDTSIAVLVDVINQAKYTGTREDVYLPHPALNASVTGLVSVTISNNKYKGPNDFHAAIYLEELEKDDQSESFVNRVSDKFEKQEPVEINTGEVIDDNEINRITKMLNKDKKNLNLGINEAARAVLRRQLEKLVVSDINDKNLIPLIKLAKCKNIPVVEMPIRGYKAVSVANDNYIR